MATLLNPMQDFGLANVLQIGSPGGVLVYVDSAAHGGDDANDGLAPGRPKLTIEDALTICNDDDRLVDTIVLQGRPGETTFPIVLDVGGVNIIASPGAGYWPRVWLTSTGGNDMFDMQANYNNIVGVGMRAAAGQAGVAFHTGGVYRCGIFRCTLETGAYGILDDVGLAANHEFSHNFFVSALTVNGILLAGDSGFPRIVGNIFDQIPGYAILSTGGGHAGQVIDNIFGMPDDTDTVDGRAISLTGLERRWIISGNRANFDDTTMTQNPYRDVSASGTPNHWMDNMQGITLVDPATA